MEFVVDVRYAVDLMSMSMDFQFAVPFKADRDDITKSLTNYTAGFDKSLFNIIAAETDRDTGAPINDEGGANKSLAGDRVYVIRPINLVDRLEFYLNGSFVGQIPHTRTQMSFAEHLLISSILYGTGPLPKRAPTNNILPSSDQRWEEYLFLNSDMYNNWSTYPLTGFSQKNYQCSVPVGKLAVTLGLPSDYLTGNTFTIRSFFKSSSTEQINAAVYANPALQYVGTRRNTDDNVISATDAMSILQNSKLYWDRLSDSRATVTKDVNNLMDINQGKNVYEAHEWTSETIKDIVQGGNYNVNVNAGQSPKFIIAYFQYSPPIAQPANYATSLFTQRNVQLYKPPNGTVMDIQVQYNYKHQYLRNLSFDQGGNSVCDEMYKGLRDHRKMNVGGDYTDFKDYRERYPLIYIPVSKSHADVNLPGQTSSLDNGVVHLTLSLKGTTRAFANNIDLRVLVISEAWQVRQNSRTGVYRISTGELINNGFLTEGINFADKNRPAISQRVGITEQMLQ